MFRPYRMAFRADVSARKPIRYGLKERIATTWDWSERPHTSNIVTEWLVHEIPVLTPKYLQWFLFLAPTYSLPLRIEYLFSIHKVSLVDRRGAASASLRHRNRVEITVLESEQKPHPVWFSCRGQSHPV